MKFFMVLMAILVVLWGLVVYREMHLTPAQRIARDEARRAEAAEESARQDRSVEAMVTCEQFVSRRLKSPGSAKFSHAWDTEIRGRGEGPYIVRGFVDSQNGFGALLRSQYGCSVQLQGTSWTLRDLAIQ